MTSHTTVREHHFRVAVAEVVGVNAAIILEQLNYWIDKNVSLEHNFHDGHYWTYNTIKSFKRSYPYMSEKAIRTALGKLEDGGYILVGDYNQNRYTRPKWYSITEAGYALLDSDIQPKGQHEVPKRATRSTEKGNSLYSINSSSSTSSSSTDICASAQKGKTRKFVPPTLEEVQAYIAEKGYHFSAQEFIEYYEADNWHLSNGKPVRAWKRCCATWEKHWNDGSGSARNGGPSRDFSEFAADKWRRG